MNDFLPLSNNRGRSVAGLISRGVWTCMYYIFPQPSRNIDSSYSDIAHEGSRILGSELRTDQLSCCWSSPILSTAASSPPLASCDQTPPIRGTCIISHNGTITQTSLQRRMNDRRISRPAMLNGYSMTNNSLKHNHNPNAAGGVSHVFERGLREWPHKQYPNLLHDNDLTFNSWWYTVYVCMFCDVSLCPNQFQFRRCFFFVLGEASHVPHRVVGFGPPGFSGRLPRPCSTLLGATEPALRWVHLDVNFPLKQ